MDNHDEMLDRFVRVQQSTYTAAREELLEGRKEGHSKWFIFPQLRGLGHSTMSTKYCITSLAEAKAFAQHAVLGVRLKECAGIPLATPKKCARDVLGAVDALKLCSCMTLFAHAADTEPMFKHALHRFCNGRPDERTLSLLSTMQVERD
jgi:uncharacterized protein (DUF1810 family)